MPAIAAIFALRDVPDSDQENETSEPRQKANNDQGMQFGDQPAAFGGKRLIAEGFKPMRLSALTA